MLQSLVRTAVRNPVATNLAVLALLLAGLSFYLTTPREVFPDFSLGKVEVLVTMPGAGPEDIERRITDPVEEALAEIPDVDEITSTSQEGIVRLQLTLSRGADMEQVLRKVREAIDGGDLDLPDLADTPIVREVETIFPVINVQVFGPAPWRVLHETAKAVRRDLEAISGVRDVRVIGKRDPELWVELDPAALERHQLELAQVQAAVRARLMDLPLGRVQEEGGEWLVTWQDPIGRAEDLRELPIEVGREGQVLRLGQIAHLVDTFERERTRARFQGQPSVHMQVNKVADGDIIALADTVREYVAEQASRVPPGVQVGVNADVSIYVKNRLETMNSTARVGAILVLLSLLAFLNLRVALAVALGIPLAFLGGLLLAGSAGVTMNMITMFALIVVLGMVVDDAIVVGENIHRRIEEGEDPESAAVEGTLEVAPAVLATVATSVAAFLPLLMLEGQVGLFMRPMPLVVSFCLVASLAEALTALPVHIAHWAARPRGGRAHAPKSTAWWLPLRALYLRFMETCLRLRYLTLTVVVCLAVLVAALVRYHLPMRFFDDFETTMFYVAVDLPPGTGLDR
ncbi:MAG: efflux RND transporter permease subunit, partial [Planctomycetota bacterium]